MDLLTDPAMTVLYLTAAKWHVAQHTGTISVVLLYMGMWAGGCLHSFQLSQKMTRGWWHVGYMWERLTFWDVDLLIHITGAVIPKGAANLKQYFKIKQIINLNQKPFWNIESTDLQDVIICSNDRIWMICVILLDRMLCQKESGIKSMMDRNIVHVLVFKKRAWHYLQGSTGFWVTYFTALAERCITGADIGNLRRGCDKGIWSLAKAHHVFLMHWDQNLLSTKYYPDLRVKENTDDPVSSFANKINCCHLHVWI